VRIEDGQIQVNLDPVAKAPKVRRPDGTIGPAQRGAE
jgi:hypothetical protein